MAVALVPVTLQVIDKSGFAEPLLNVIVRAAFAYLILPVVAEMVAVEDGDASVEIIPVTVKTLLVKFKIAPPFTVTLTIVAAAPSVTELPPVVAIITLSVDKGTTPPTQVVVVAQVPPVAVLVIVAAFPAKDNEKNRTNITAVFTNAFLEFKYKLSIVVDFLIGDGLLNRCFSLKVGLVSKESAEPFERTVSFRLLTVFYYAVLQLFIK